ncbi:MAG: dTMP kinase [candidate division WOR-3 bacterium]
MRRGLFITFEGTEGSGKSTQAKLLYDWLITQDLPCLLTREPGGTKIGEAVRGILLDPLFKELSVKTELFLFLAARAQLVSEVILPAINQGKIVISDRFSDSTYAYQVYGRKLPERPTMLLNRFATSGLKPDITFLIDLPVEEGLKRNRLIDQDRFEKEPLPYHLQVREGYLRLARRAGGRIKLVDGRQPVEVIQSEIQNRTRVILLKKGYKI